MASFAHLAWGDAVEEMNRFNDCFYSYPQIVRRMLRFARNTRNPKTLLVVLIANLSYRSNYRLDKRVVPAVPTHSSADQEAYPGLSQCLLPDTPHLPAAAPGRRM